MLLHLDPIWVMFEGEGHRSKTKVVGMTLRVFKCVLVDGRLCVFCFYRELSSSMRSWMRCSWLGCLTMVRSNCLCLSSYIVHLLRVLLIPVNATACCGWLVVVAWPWYVRFQEKSRWLCSEQTVSFAAVSCKMTISFRVNYVILNGDGACRQQQPRPRQPGWLALFGINSDCKLSDSVPHESLVDEER